MPREFRLSMLRLPLQHLLVSFALLAQLAVAQTTVETILTEFARPEDFSDLAGTPYLLVTEFGEFREEVGTLALLDTTDNTKVMPTITVSSDQLSLFADPTCTPRLPLANIAPQGTAAWNNGDGTWDVAVVNHNAYESIEFFVLTIGTDGSPPTLATAGCTRSLGEGDAHNDVAFSSDGSRLFVTLWMNNYTGVMGLLGVLWSFLKPLPGGQGALKEIDVGGTASVITSGLNGANGLLFLNDSRIVVAENSATKITAVNPVDGSTETLLEARMVDNIMQDSPSSFLFTRIDAPFSFRVLPCNILGMFCTLPFTIVRYDWEAEQQTDVYSSSLDGLATVAMSKNNALYVGNVLTDRVMAITTLLE